MILPIQDINTPCIITDSVQEFGDGENADFETVFVLTNFDSPDYNYLYKRDNRIIGPPVVLHCAAKEEVSHSGRHLFWGVSQTKMRPNDAIKK